MAQYQYVVTSAQLTQVQYQLTTYNDEFLRRVSDLEKLQQQLKGMWQGDANNAFDAAFNNDKQQWTKFAALMKQYIEALGKIAAAYDKAESTNVETAKKRTY